MRFRLKGELVIDCDYSEVKPFVEGFAAVSREGRWGFIDTRGKQLVECKYRSVKSFSDGLAAVSAKDSGGRVSWGFINSKGEAVGYFEKIEGLEIKLPDSFDFQYGKILIQAGYRIDGCKRLKKYLGNAGAKGKYSKKAAKLLAASGSK